MIIRDFPSCMESVDDIKNITEKRRYILIFKYDDIHHGYNYCYNSMDHYDIYLINESVTHGVNYVIPNNFSLLQRNQYRGVIINPFTDSNNINLNADTIFLNGSYTLRVHNDNGDILKLSNLDEATAVEYEIVKMLKTELILPFPKFYNAEDQAIFGKKSHDKYVGDFWMDFNELPTYKLGELVDPYTKIAIIDMPFRNDLVNASPESESYFFDDDPYITFNNGKTVDLQDFKDNLTYCFIESNMYIMRSIFSQVDIIIDIDSGLFNIVPSTLRTKFKELSKKEVLDELTILTQEISDVVDHCFGEYDNTPTEIYKNNMCPNRIYMHISNTGCKIKLTNTCHMKHIFATGESSAGDIDEICTVTSVS